jgi:hypothetical protein
MRQQPTYAELDTAIEAAGDYFVADFVEWALGDLTVHQFAKYKKITVKEAEQKIEIGSKIYAQRHEEGK